MDMETWENIMGELAVLEYSNDSTTVHIGYDEDDVETRTFDTYTEAVLFLLRSGFRMQ